LNFKGLIRLRWKLRRDEPGLIHLNLVQLQSFNGLTWSD